MSPRDRNEMIQALYSSNERLMTLNEVLRELGQHEAATHERDAACDVVRAIAKLVKERVEDGAASCPIEVAL
jgi:hypothetical protein